jgi:hypothetical protein
LYFDFIHDGISFFSFHQNRIMRGKRKDAL